MDNKLLQNPLTKENFSSVAGRFDEKVTSITLVLSLLSYLLLPASADEQLPALVGWFSSLPHISKSVYVICCPVKLLRWCHSSPRHRSSAYWVVIIAFVCFFSQKESLGKSPRCRVVDASSIHKGHWPRHNKITVIGSFKINIEKGVSAFIHIGRLCASDPVDSSWLE